jgi:hypothetical protein
LNFKPFARLLLLAPLLMLSGCASVSVGNIHPKGVPPKKLPEKIYVSPFVAPVENFRVGRGEKDLNAFIKEEQKNFTAALVAQLSKHIAPAEALPEGKSAPKGNYWLITGIYDRVNQGSRALRIGVGFGAGGTKLETRVLCSTLTSVKPTPFLSMLTTGGSGIAPGAWAAFTPAGAFYIPGAVANAGGASLGGLSVDRARTAREITAALSEYCFTNGLITERRTRRPKKVGMLPSVQRPDFVIPKKGL